MIAGLRRALRRHVPESARQWLALSRRALTDRASGAANRIAQGQPDPAATAAMRRVARVIQPVRQTAHSAGKIANLALAAARMNHVVLRPGAIFSFWALVGAPTAANGFAVGRSIMADRLVAEIGGGLCQISGLVYELGLRGGLAVRERHPHSRDIYTEETRFTPLGLDATVVHGFKDLRLENTTGAAIAFSFDLDAERMTGELWAAATITPCQLRLERDDIQPGLRRVTVSRVWPDGRLTPESASDYVVDVASA